MKLCHFSDTHLGAGGGYPRRGPSGLTIRQEDIINSFIEAVDRIIEINPDLCIHAGDLFDSVRPLNRIIAIAGQQLYRLAEEHGIPTVIITGNHDAPKQPHLGAALEIFAPIDNLYVAAGPSLSHFDIRGVRITALPHALTTQAQRQALEQCRPDPDARFNVLVLHGVAAGMPEFSMADLGEQELPLELMTNFDYTALGHFHNFCQVAPRAFYAGSTERLSQSERAAAKGFAEIDLDPFNVTFREVKCREMADIATIDATGKRGDQLVSEIKEHLDRVNSAEKIVRVNIAGVSEETIKTMPPNMLTELKQNSFSLDIRFERRKDDEQTQLFGRTAIGRLDHAFVKYLESVELEGFDRDRLIEQAVRYLALPE